MKSVEQYRAAFWKQVDRRGENECWPWVGFVERHGYARARFLGKRVLVHRLAYEELVGPIPDGLDLDHLCRTRHCVNPKHHEAVPNRVNVLRGIGPTAVNARKTHCAQGHNLSLYGKRTKRRDGVARQCRVCRRLYLRDLYRRKILASGRPYYPRPRRQKRPTQQNAEAR